MDNALNEIRDRAFIAGVESVEKLNEEQIKAIAKKWFIIGFASGDETFRSAWQREKDRNGE